MKPAELRAMSDEQLVLTRKDTIKHLFQLRIQSATDRLETPSEVRKAKKDLARINTLQRERELAALEGLSAEQLRQRLQEIDATLKKPEVPVERRKVRRARGRLMGLLRQQEETRKKTAKK